MALCLSTADKIAMSGVTRVLSVSTPCSRRFQFIASFAMKDDKRNFVTALAIANTSEKLCVRRAVKWGRCVVDCW